ncbi:MAG: sulfotransferase domain-containing protein [Solirubrobacterales bacterium]
MPLDFLVIGAQKGGTTSLWRYLSPHPRLCMPAMKEAAFFNESEDLDLLERHMRVIYADAPSGALLGKVSPNYMIGQPGAGVEIVVGRIAAVFPNVKLIALLRDPIERAVSNYVMAVRREQEARPLDTAFSELLQPDQLASSRVSLGPTDSYIVAGEYGRVLGAYREAFPAEQMLVTFSDDLAGDPGRVIASVLSFLGLPADFRPPDLDLRHFRSGTRRLLDREAERTLFKFFGEEILPKMRGSSHANRVTFDFFYETWNVAPDESPPRVSGEVRAKLETHFEEDARRLEDLGVQAPWIARWEKARAATEGALQGRLHAPHSACPSGPAKRCLPLCHRQDD